MKSIRIEEIPRLFQKWPFNVDFRPENDRIRECENPEIHAKSDFHDFSLSPVSFENPQQIEKTYSGSTNSALLSNHLNLKPF